MGWMPVGEQNDPFRIPKNPGGYWQQGDFAKTPVGTNLLENPSNRQAAFAYYNRMAGIDPLSNQGYNYQRLFPQVSQGYEASLPEYPDLTFGDYWKMIQPNVQNYLLGLTPAEQGKNITQFVRPARTIPRGYA